MEHKGWLWRKKTNEKASVAREKVEKTLRGIEDEGFRTETETDELVKSLNGKLVSGPCDCNAKEELLTKQSKIAQEAIEGLGRAEAEVVYLTKELDTALQQKLAAEEKLNYMDSAVKECMQQLNMVKEEQEVRVCDAVAAQQKLEMKLSDESRRVEDLAADNTQLSKALLVKERLIEDLIKCKSQVDAELSALMPRLDSTEKENAFLRYEFCMLEKELKIRNEERVYTWESAEALRRQQLDSMKKITRLETECQRLRALLRKRLPGQGALAKIKSEVNILGREQEEMRRRRRMNPVTGGLVIRDSCSEKSVEIPSEKIGYLVDQLFQMEEENRILKDIMAKKNEELDFSRNECAKTSTKLAQLESQLGQHFKDNKSMEPMKRLPISNEISLPLGFNVGNGDHTSSPGSWASALITELEHFRNEKVKNPSEGSIEVPDIRLMDDFVEMEKLAIVSVDAPSASSNAASNSDIVGKELVTSSHCHSSSIDMKDDIRTRDESSSKSRDWLQDVLKAMLEQNRVSKKSLSELLDDIKIAIAYINNTSTEADTEATPRYSMESNPLHISGFITWKSPNPSQIVDSEETGSQKLQSRLSSSISRLTELIEGICSTYKHSEMATDFVHVFQWKSSEMIPVLQQFVQACNDVLKGEADMKIFTDVLASVLDSVMKNCIACQDVSSVKDNKIKGHFLWDQSQYSGDEFGAGQCNPSSESDKVNVSEDKIQHNVPKENIKGKGETEEIKSGKEDLEARLRSATDRNEALMTQVQEMEQNMGRLEREAKTLRESNEVIEDPTENQTLINEDLETQLTVAKSKLNEVLQKLSSLEVELEDKSNCCEELESMCLELQLQLESTAKKDDLAYNIAQEGMQLQTGLEVQEVSMKLTECQETIHNLGKQLKSLATSKEANISDRASSNTISTPKHKNSIHRASLRDQLKVEADVEVLKFPRIKNNLSSLETEKPPILQFSDFNSSPPPKILDKSPGLEGKTGGTVGVLAVIPSKKSSTGGFLRKLLRRRKRGMKTSKSVVP